MNRKKLYLIDGRLADILGLIQVLAIDDHAHRSEPGLKSEMQGNPISAPLWGSLAAQHPEFFRFREKSEHSISLIARHVTERDPEGKRPLSPEFTKKLMEIAIQLYDKQKELSEQWKFWIPVVAVIVSGLITIIVTIFLGGKH
jgi:hypothetical protein